MIKHVALMLTLSLTNNILCPLHRALLSKNGVNRNFPITIVPVSPAVGELGLRSLEIEQGLEQLGLLIAYLVNMLKLA